MQLQTIYLAALLIGGILASPLASIDKRGPPAPYGRGPPIMGYPQQQQQPGMMPLQQQQRRYAPAGQMPGMPPMAGYPQPYPAYPQPGGGRNMPGMAQLGPGARYPPQPMAGSMRGPPQQIPSIPPQQGARGPMAAGGPGPRGPQGSYKLNNSARNAPEPQSSTPAGPVITAAALAAAGPAQQKQMLGEALYPRIHESNASLAGKITGMLLEMDNSELLHLLENDDALNNKVSEAIDVLEEYAKKAAA